jgi:uncharacterized FlgJ-related protein
MNERERTQPNDNLLDIRKAYETFKSMTTSDKMWAITQAQIQADKELRAHRAQEEKQQQELAAALAEIKRMKEQERQERQKNDPWKFLRNVARFIVGEIDKSDKR